jgi:putative peptide zinc metalloprotease protein
MNETVLLTSVNGEEIHIGSIENSSDSLIQINGRVFRVNEFTTFLIHEVSVGRSVEETLAKVNANGVFSKSLTIEQLTALIAQKILPLFARDAVFSDQLSKIRFKIVLLRFQQMRFILQLFKPLFNPNVFYTLLTFGALVTAGFFLLFRFSLPSILNVTANSFFSALVFLFVVSLLHELGHATAAYKNKIVPAEIGTGLYFLFPVFYADVTETWRLNPRKRLMVNLGGVYMQVLVNIGLIIFILSGSGGVHREFIVQIIIANTFSIGVNLIPFLKLDGYWLVADLFNIPNLQRSSTDYTKSIFLWAIRKETEMPTFNLPLFCYSIGQIIFATFMVFTMILLMKNSFFELVNIGAGDITIIQAVSKDIERHTLIFLFTCIVCVKIYNLLSKLWKKSTK